MSMFNGAKLLHSLQNLDDDAQQRMDTTESRCSLPFAIEYAKSGRSTCKLCKSNIGNGIIRMSARERSTHFDGMQDNWFHFACFWRKIKPGKDQINESSIRGVDWLKWDDQELLRRKIQIFKDGNVDGEAGNAARNELKLSLMKIGAASSARGKCAECSELIPQGLIKCQYKSKWFHPACVFKKFSIIEGTIDEIGCWAEFTVDQKQELTDAYTARLKELFQKKKEEDREKRRKDAEAKALAAMKSDTPSVVPELSSDIPSSSSDPSSNVGEKTKRAIVVDPDEDEGTKRRRLAREARAANKTQDRLKKQAEKIWNLKQIFEEMADKDWKTILEVNDQDIPAGKENTITRLVDIALFGRPAPCPECINGKLVYSSAYRTYLCTGYATEYTKCRYENKNPVRLPFVMPENIYKGYKIESYDFNSMVERAYNEEETIVNSNDNKSFSYLGARRFKDQMLPEETHDFQNAIHGNLNVEKSTARLIIKKGTVVDPKFPYAEKYHVHRTEEDGLLAATLSDTDLSCNKNSFYKIYLMKHDNLENDYYLFKTWGRTGTEVGNISNNRYGDEVEAIRQFHESFKEKTKNEWSLRKYFKKVRGMFSYVDTDFSEIEKIADNDVEPGSKSSLPKPVIQIIKTIFDENVMKKEMQSFEMDINKMPLGKLSQDQIKKAMRVLNDISELLLSQQDSEIKILDASNKFYSIIPHNFGLRPPEPIDTFKKIKEKNLMLTALLEIKLAYDTMKTDAQMTISNVDPVDVHYEQLQCAMAPIDKSSHDYKMVAEYLKNTQGSTHGIQAELLDVISLSRFGEREKFVNPVGVPTLLWHGSLKTNYAGILKQGLRIAPPEAPVSGYMFGKGVYFADMFSKSANYCRAHVNEEAWLLLCVVSLGNMHCLLNATNMSLKQLPAGFQSVKGEGREYPHASGMYYHPNGYYVPKGKPVNDTSKPYYLQYNEYIVYDTNQIKLEFLVRVRVKRS